MSLDNKFQINVISIFKDIIDKVESNIRYLSHTYFVNIRDFSFDIRYHFKYSEDVIIPIELYKKLFDKIYKYRDYYWNFILVNYVIESPLDLYVNISVKISTELTSYFEYVPRELLNIIGLYLDILDITNYCAYLNKWLDYCDEGLYEYLYREKFPKFYQLVKPFIKYDISTWENKYRTLIWEEIYNIDNFIYKYKYRKSPNTHINFILQIYDFLYSSNIDVRKFINLYTTNYKLFYDLNNYLIRSNPYRSEIIRNVLIGRGIKI